ncbi:MAG TPA: sugar ABC transporter permease [Lachnospiraceae bacterium]|nr:sugar ABC transporter permease [Lachnospiraceae bacterium]
MKKKFMGIFSVIFLTLISLWVLYPLVYVLSGAFAPGASIANLSVVPFQNGFTLEHFVHLFTRTDYPRWFLNTFIIAIGTTVLTVSIAALSAYVFSRFQFKLKKKMLMAMLILQIFPSFVGMVAIYVILLRINALDTLWGLILVYVAGNIPYNTWMVKTYVDTVPKSLDEAARIDGASHWRIFTTIVMPVTKPILVFTAIASFAAPWMDYIFPKMVLRSSEMQTLALGLFTFVSDKKNQFTSFAAGSLLVAIPFIIFFVAAQDLIISSLAGGSVKE